MQSLHSENSADRLFSNLHPTLIFYKVITRQYAEIENVLVDSQDLHKGSVNATGISTGVTEHALDSLSWLMNYIIVHQLWNESNHFDFLIAVGQKRYVSVTLEHFSRLSLVCVVS